MANPDPYNRTFSFNDFQASNPSSPLPGVQVDNELENVEAAINGTQTALEDIRRSDGALKNGIVTVDSLSPQVAAGVGAGALASAEAAANSADAAASSALAASNSASAASGSADDASGYAGNALTSRNEASGFSDDASEMAVAAAGYRDFAAAWASAGEGVDVDDGVNPVSKSSYHWAQVALGAAAGSIADGAITTAKLANGALSADTTGRAKMADGFVTSAKIADGSITTAKLSTGHPTWDASGNLSDVANFSMSGSLTLSGSTASRVLVTDASKIVTPSAVTDTELGYLSGVGAPLAKAQVRNTTSVSVSMTGKTAGTGGKLFDVPANCSRILFRAINLGMGAGENFGLRFYNPTDGLFTSGYAGGHARMSSGVVSVSTSPSFLVVCGWVTAPERYDGVFELVRGSYPNHAWLMPPVQLAEGTGVNIMRLATGYRFMSNPLTEIHLHGNGTFSDGTLVADFFIDA